MNAIRNQVSTSAKTPRTGITMALGLICGVYAALLCSLYLLCFSLDGYTAISQYKYTAFLTLAIGFLLIFALVKAEHRLLVPQQPAARTALPFRTVWQSPHTYFILYLLFTGISALQSDFSTVILGWDRKEGLLTIALYVISYLLLSLYGRFGQALLWIFSASMVLFTLLGIVQLMGCNPLALYPEPYTFYDAGVYYSGQYWSTIGNTNLCAAVLSIAVGVCTMTMIRRQRRRGYLFAIPLALCVFSLIALNAEAGLVAMLVGLLVLLPVGIHDAATLKNSIIAYGIILFAVGLSGAVVFYDGGCYFQQGANTFIAWASAGLLLLAGCYLPAIPALANSLAIKRSILSVILICGIAGLFVLYFAEALPLGFLTQAHEILHGNIDDSFGSGRIYIWREVIARIPDDIWFGSGPDTLAFLNIESFRRYDADLGFYIVEGIDAAHNEYLNILIHQGVFATASYCIGIALSLRRWWQCSHHPRVAIAGAGVCFYLIQAFFGISMYISAPFFWLALAALNQRIEEDETVIPLKK